MQKYKKPVIKEEELGSNPCIIPLQIPVVKWESSSFKVDDDGDTMFDEYFIEVETSLKVYTSYQRRLMYNSLSASSSKLLLWIMMELKNNKDYVWINKQRYMDESGMSYNTLKNSIKELHKNNLIQPTIKTDIYWINPYYFFPGNRVNKYKDNVNITQDRTQE